MWIQISAGKGPDECEHAVGLFLKTILNENNNNNTNAKVIEVVPGNYSGDFKSVLLSLDNYDLSDFIGDCNHSILWICKSPYRLDHKRKNWFINIEIFQSSEKLNFSEKDVKFESMRSSGPGGQHVNKVETAVRALHLPTGLTVSASEERSQYLNKKLALSRLSNMIEAQNEKSTRSQKRAMWKQHSMLTRGNPSRIYIGEEFKLEPVMKGL